MSDDFVIFSYTADDAMRDGQLIEVEAKMTKEAGFKWPVRITQGVFDLVNPSEEAQAYDQDFEGRMWDVLNLARVAISKAPPDERLVTFVVAFQDGSNKQYDKTLWAGIDMTSGPAIHIMKPEEY